MGTHWMPCYQRVAECNEGSGPSTPTALVEQRYVCEAGSAFCGQAWNLGSSPEVAVKIAQLVFHEFRDNGDVIEYGFLVDQFGKC